MRTEEKLDGKNTTIQYTILNHPGNNTQKTTAVLPISQTLQVRRIIILSTSGMVGEIFQYTPKYRRNSIGRPARSYIHQLFADTRCRLEDPPGVISYKEEFEVRELRTIRTLDDDDDDIMNIIPPFSPYLRKRRKTLRLKVETGSNIWNIFW